MPVWRWEELAWNARDSHSLDTPVSASTPLWTLLQGVQICQHAMLGLTALWDVEAST